MQKKRQLSQHNLVTLDEIQSFWDNHPLFEGESNFKPGTKEFFDEHRHVYIQDCFAGTIDPRLFPDETHELILYLGCGTGFWTIEFQLTANYSTIISADLSFNSLEIANKRTRIYKCRTRFIQANAERLPFRTGVFDFINCQGVIHHTPNTEKCIEEIGRVLKPGGFCIISVYYRNFLLRHWKKFRWLGQLLLRIGAEFKGRGRESIFTEKNADEIVRLYDGSSNPLGKAYSKQHFLDMVSPYLEVQDLFYHFFPARALPFKFPKKLHQLMDKNLPFMIYVKARKGN